MDFHLPELDELRTAQEEGVLIPILMPGTQQTLLNVRVTGPDSEAHRRAIERGSEEYTARGALTPLTPAEQKTASCRFLARVCTGWDAKDSQGQVIPFTEDAAAELFERYPLIREQVDNAAANRARFTKRSPTA